MMRIEGDDLIFSTGRVEYANGGIVGLDSGLDLFGGYDGSIPSHGALTDAERKELADYMIALWQKFREADGPLPEEH